MKITRWRTAQSFVDLPEAAGVYVFILDGRAFYVGSTVNLYQRLKTHTTPPRGFFDNPPVPPRQQKLIACQEIRYRESRRFGDWLMWEARLINRLRPEGNAKGRGR